MALTTNRLSVDHRLRHHLIVHQILPTGGGYAKLSRMQVFLMWCILSKIEFIFPLLMLKTMVRAFSQKKSVLPFGSILTKVFQHFHIRLEGEVAAKLKKEDTYNKSTLNRMGWKKQEGIWTYCPKVDQAPRIAREEQEDNPPWEAQEQAAPAQPQAQSSSSTTDYGTCVTNSLFLIISTLSVVFCINSGPSTCLSPTSSQQIGDLHFLPYKAS
ncbi:hypothetical protein CFOL_v3_31598 [Cephalotus follicularis]|uniref:Uncharacterized protein n=1 Tax=Cephalotus follicularis TaxID=3775 RepID=A0A1Q3D6V1_CEPFO|nr:hypothetical protein CFOL_v3_31598 [Cephalotus follicularis]